jgi:adenine phosphoribosyltransferase
MTAPKTYPVTIAGVSRVLPVRRVPAGIRIAILKLACDPELTEAAGMALAKRMPPDVDIIVMPDGKAQSLLHVVQRETGLPAVLCRKEIKSYMLEPIIDSTATSATTAKSVFYMDAEDVAAVRGKNVAFLDDVISLGGTSEAIRELLKKAEARTMIEMAVGTEGDERPNVIALHHFPVYPG